MQNDNIVSSFRIPNSTTTLIILLISGQQTKLQSIFFFNTDIVLNKEGKAHSTNMLISELLFVVCEFRTKIVSFENT